MLTIQTLIVFFYNVPGLMMDENHSKWSEIIVQIKNFV